MQFVSGFLIAGLLWFGADWLADRYFKTPDAVLLLRYFALYFIVLNLFQVISSLFIAVQNVKRQQAVEAVRMRTVVILTFLSLTWGMLDLISFMQWRLVGVGVALVGSRWGLKRHFRRLLRDYPLVWDKTLIRQQRAYGLWILIGV